MSSLTDLSILVFVHGISKMTDVLVQKFSFPLTCSPCHAQPDQQPIAEEEKHHHGNQVQEPGTKEANEKPKHVNSVMDTTSALKDKEEYQGPIKACLTTDKQKGNLLQVTGRGRSKPHPADSTSQTAFSHKTVFEKWASLQCEEQRPSTKRQLSAESAAKCVSVRKRSTVTGSRGEPAKPLTRTDPGTQPRKACLPINSSSQRKPRRQLFSSTGVFHKVDTHAISAGREVTHTYTEMQKNSPQMNLPENCLWHDCSMNV